MFPFRPLFIGAIVFGGLARILELYVLCSSSRESFYHFWQGNEDLAFSPSDGIHVCCVLFLVVAAIESFAIRRSGEKWALLGICAILVCYGYLLNRLMDFYRV